MASLTREEMGKIIDRGESVYVRDKDNGLRIVSHRDHLPSEAELAKASSDPEKIRLAEEALDAQIKALQDAKAGLSRPAPLALAEPEKAALPTPPKAEPKGK